LIEADRNILLSIPDLYYSHSTTTTSNSYQQNKITEEYIKSHINPNTNIGLFYIQGNSEQEEDIQGNIK